MQTCRNSAGLKWAGFRRVLVAAACALVCEFMRAGVVAWLGAIPLLFVIPGVVWAEWLGIRDTVGSAVEFAVIVASFSVGNAIVVVFIVNAVGTIDTGSVAVGMAASVAIGTTGAQLCSRRVPREGRGVQQHRSEEAQDEKPIAVRKYLTAVVLTAAMLGMIAAVVAAIRNVDATDPRFISVGARIGSVQMNTDQGELSVDVSNVETVGERVWIGVTAGPALIRAWNIELGAGQMWNRETRVPVNDELKVTVRSKGRSGSIIKELRVDWG